MVCASSLQYLEKPQDASCHYCGTMGQWHIICSVGHVVCDSCHNQEAMKQLESIIFESSSTNPMEIAEQCMAMISLPMLGCQHAFIAGGAVMAALKNDATFILTDDDLREVFLRTAKQAHGGYCGLTGTCGIAPALGACVAVITGSRCGCDVEQRQTMELVSRVMRAITQLTGPSCCKAYIRCALAVTVSFLEETFGVQLPVDVATECRHMDHHPHGCRQQRCPYFPLGGTESLM